MKEATALENAVQRVAEAGRDALQAAEKNDRGSGWLVPSYEMSELRSAVKEWTDATQAFMQALRAPGTEG